MLGTPITYSFAFKGVSDVIVTDVPEPTTILVWGGLALVCRRRVRSQDVRQAGCLRLDRSICIEFYEPPRGSRAARGYLFICRSCADVISKPFLMNSPQTARVVFPCFSDLALPHRSS